MKIERTKTLEELTNAGFKEHPRNSHIYFKQDEEKAMIYMFDKRDEDFHLFYYGKKGYVEEILNE